MLNMLNLNASFETAFLTFAQEAAAGGGDMPTFNRLDILNRPNELLELMSHWPFFHAAVAVVVGLLCVLNGYRWHKWVIVVLAFIGGYLLGMFLAQHIGRSAVVALSLGVLCAIVATPMLRIAVAIFAGITGAFIGANIWSALGTVPPELSWAGAAMGFIVLAMSSFILFRFAIVLFTSIGGAAMMVLGGITLLLHVDAWSDSVRTSLENNQALLPLLLALAAVAGFVLQQSRVRAEAGGGAPGS